VRSNFLLTRIADAEKIEESDAEVYQAILQVAQREQMPVKKLAGELARSGGINRLRDQIRITKALDLIASSAIVKEPAAPEAA